MAIDIRTSPGGISATMPGGSAQGQLGSMLGMLDRFARAQARRGRPAGRRGLGVGVGRANLPPQPGGGGAGGRAGDGRAGGFGATGADPLVSVPRFVKHTKWGVIPLNKWEPGAAMAGYDRVSRGAADEMIKGPANVLMQQPGPSRASAGGGELLPPGQTLSSQLEALRKRELDATGLQRPAYHPGLAPGGAEAMAARDEDIERRQNPGLAMLIQALGG